MQERSAQCFIFRKIALGFFRQHITDFDQLSDESNPRADWGPGANALSLTDLIVNYRLATRACFASAEAVWRFYRPSPHSNAGEVAGKLLIMPSGEN